MREYTSPGEVEVSPEENLTDALWEAAASNPTRPVLAHRVGDRFVEWSMQQFADEVQAVAKGLMALGIDKGDKVCLYSATRLEWTILDFAIWAAGAVTVPIYETSSSEQVEWIGTDSGAVALLVENDTLKAEYDAVADRLPDVKHVFVIEDGALEDLKQRGSDVSDEQVRERAASVTGADLATIVYTSGTTGKPKGCVITHHNFVWDAVQTEAAVPEILRPGESTLLFLPLAHIFARVIQTACIRSGMLLGFSTGIPQLLEELKLFQPTFLIAVPRVFEKVFNGAQQKAHAEGKGKIFDKAAAVAEEYSRQSRAGKVKLGTKLLHGVFDKLVYVKLRDAMGGRVRYAASGSAALGERLGHFFDGIGIPIIEGYGLTESTAVATLNQPSALRIGTIGKPIPGGSVRIDDDGEILLKGGHIFQGYYNNDAATAEVMDGEWFRTGDLGTLDGEGFLRITGRKKDILVTAGGKNVAPAVLEDRLRAHALVSQAMVVGDGKPFIAALITLDKEALPAWAEANDKPSAEVEDLIDDPDVRASLDQAVEDANKAVSRAESIRTYRIIPQDFEVGEELTPTLKVKRNVVGERFKDVIEEIYAS